MNNKLQWMDDKTRQPITQVPDGYTDFVYLIHNTTNNRSYVGKKCFYNTTHRPPLRGKKNRRKTIKESDWKDYNGSSPQLLRDILKGHSIIKVILHYCKSKSQASYMELLEQIERKVLFDDTYYNEIINVRIKQSPQLLNHFQE